MREQKTMLEGNISEYYEIHDVFLGKGCQCVFVFKYSPMRLTVQRSLLLVEVESVVVSSKICCNFVMRSLINEEATPSEPLREVFFI